MSILFRFAADERGATAIEYGLIAAILGVGIIASLQAIKNSEIAKFDAVSTNLSN